VKTSWAFLAALTLGACEANVDEILAGKACTETGACADGYVCREPAHVCVLEGTQTTSQGGGASTTTTTTTSTGGGGGSGGCDSVTDCPAPSSGCEVPICIGGVCGTSALPMGTLSPAQTLGDCKTGVCDGAGNILQQNEATDVPDLGDCVNATCNSGTPESRSLPVGTTCAETNGTVCSGDGFCVECNVESDCVGLPASSECATRVCDAGTCMLMPAAMGTMLAAQTTGDCKKAVCDGSGGTTTQNDGADLPDDLNQCTTDGCSAGMQTHVAVMVGDPCSAGTCDALGNCVGCVQPSDCGASTFCAQRTCTAGVCGLSNTTVETPLPSGSQVSGDCQELRCDGSGAVKTVASAGDVPSDDGLECTGETCVAGSPQHPPTSLGSTCNQTGGLFCDGLGACVECNAPADCSNQGTVCQSPTCASNACGLVNDPAGDPAPAAAQIDRDCKLIVCDGSGGTTTQADGADLPVDGNACTQDVCTGTTPSNPPAAAGTPCSNGGTCDGAGNCSQKKPNGSACSTSTECMSGNCPSQDGVCCATACNGTCRSCLASKTGGTTGTCGLIPAGEDPDLECAPTNQTCDGAGACLFDCGQTPTPATSACPAACTGGCTAGTCIIDCPTAGACQGAALDCPDGFACRVQCTGTGTCDDATVTCPPFYACDVACASGACGQTAVTCDDGACSLTCNGNNTCTGASVGCGVNTCHAICNSAASKPQVACGSSCDCVTCGKALGAPCLNSSECASGFCPTQDKVCCEAACSGLCEGCAMATTGQPSGSCEPILNGLDPNAECTGPKTCNGNLGCTP
jgi:hypothetical protein